MESVLTAVCIVLLIPTVHFSPLFPLHDHQQKQLATVQFSQSGDRAQTDLPHAGKAYHTRDSLYGGEVSRGTSSDDRNLLHSGSQDLRTDPGSRAPSHAGQSPSIARNSQSQGSSLTDRFPSVVASIDSLVRTGAHLRALSPASLLFHFGKLSDERQRSLGLIVSHSEDSTLLFNPTVFKTTRPHRDSSIKQRRSGFSPQSAFRDRGDGDKTHTKQEYPNTNFARAPQNSTHPLGVVLPPRNKLHHIAAHRSKRSYSTLPYKARPNDVQQQVATEATSSRLDPKRLKRVLQKLYQMFLSGENTDIQPDSLPVFLAANDVGSFQSVKDNSPRTEQTSVNTLTPTLPLDPLSTKQLSQFELDPTLNIKLLEDRILSTAPEPGSDAKLENLLSKHLMKQYVDALASVRNRLERPSMEDDTAQDATNSILDDYYDHLSKDDHHIKVNIRLSMDDSPQPRVEDHSVLGQEAESPIVVSRRRGSISPAELVRTLHNPSQLVPLSPSRSWGRERQEKKKKLMELMETAQPLRKPVDNTKPRVCGQENSLVPAVTCPGDASVCVLDVMFCDGIRDCPGGEDEAPSLCVLRLWAFTWLNNIHTIFSAYIPPQPRYRRPRSRTNGRLYDGTRAS